MEKELVNPSVEMKEVEVYLANEGYELVAFLWRGAAINAINTYGGRYRKCKLHYTVDDEEKLFTIPGAITHRYRHVHYDGDGERHCKYSDFYLTAREALDAGELLDEEFNIFSGLESLLLKIDKPSASTEFKVELRKNDKGGLYTFINNHPELSGSIAEGKCFFPDKKWKGAKEGEALVSVTYERETYGFITGKMLNPVNAVGKRAMDYLWEKCDFRETVHVVTNHKHAVVAYIIGNLPNVRVLRYYKLLDEMIEKPLSVEEYLALRKECCVTAFLVYELLTMDAYDLDREGARDLWFWTPSEIYSRDIQQHRPLARITWCPDTVWSMPEGVLGQAIDEGWVTSITVEGFRDIQIYHTSVEQLGGALVLSLNEFEELTDAISRSNLEADRLIRSKIQKGKIRLCGVS